MEPHLKETCLLSGPKKKTDRGVFVKGQQVSCEEKCLSVSGGQFTLINFVSLLFTRVSIKEDPRDTGSLRRNIKSFFLRFTLCRKKRAVNYSMLAVGLEHNLSILLVYCFWPSHVRQPFIKKCKSRL